MFWAVATNVIDSMLKPVGTFPSHAQGFALDFIYFLQIWPKASGMTLFWDTHTVFLRSVSAVKNSLPPDGKQGPTESMWGPMDLITSEALMKCLYGARPLSVAVWCLCTNCPLLARQLCVLRGGLWCVLQPAINICLKEAVDFSGTGRTRMCSWISYCESDSSGRLVIKMFEWFICSQERELHFPRLA